MLLPEELSWKRKLDNHNHSLCGPPKIQNTTKECALVVQRECKSAPSLCCCRLCAHACQVAPCAKTTKMLLMLPQQAPDLS
eukprot:3179224-Amphidinium_carterae.1